MANDKDGKVGIIRSFDAENFGQLDEKVQYVEPAEAHSLVDTGRARYADADTKGNAKGGSGTLPPPQ